MKRTAAVLLMMLSLATPGAVNAAAAAVIFNQAAAAAKTEMENSEAVEREATADPDAWKAYLRVLSVVPRNAPTVLENRYRSLAVSLALKAAMACSPDALRLLERNDVIEFRVLRSSLVTACRTAR
ncbi:MULTISPECIES: hypothetical protein [Enterobacteriaceae]|uniref:hypothetical protein n=1 Tax=Enterobacteriaceae TaxID=543 RepID=UPI0016211675|nr:MULTISPECIES: hypothetical protein [Enterobacteriaceae]ELV2768929.1 hypothetical protein [Enterobacter cloacae]ELV2779956.1 hypothetical protein [Enterobacter cloacae]ULJ27386.1 hypothetical protein HUZ53_26655 [Klebsiella pneumoniae]GFQ17196.1 hypothetical protein NIHE141904_35060 [Enterobacter hormaechei]HEG2207329.1 hypothetical protein [Enterobacter cloacae]